MKGDAADTPEDGEKKAVERTNVVEVLKPNYNTVIVYMRSSWVINYIVGDKVLMVHETITSEEILSSATLLRIPRKEWPEILDNLRLYMIPAARNVLNKVKDDGRPNPKNRRQVRR